MLARTETKRSCRGCSVEVEFSETFCRVCGTVAGEPLECEQHADRKADAVCVVCGKPLCHLCRKGEASPALCGSEDHETVAAEWVRVFQSSSEFEGDSVVCNLKARGIPVKVFSSRRYLGARTAGASDAVRVFVKKNDFGRAEECLTEVTGALDDEPNNVD